MDMDNIKNNRPGTFLTRHAMKQAKLCIGVTALRLLLLLLVVIRARSKGSGLHCSH
jgi:hypothetical protein